MREETGKIFSCNELERWRSEDSGVNTQIVSGAEMHLLRAVYEPGATYEMHSHPHEQFSVLLKGRLLLTVGTETREIGPGDCWYAPAEMPHGGERLGDEPAEFLDIYAPANEWIYKVLESARKLGKEGDQ